jgi:hypothetical protein
MPKVFVPRDRIADGSLPPVCVVCGRKAFHRRFPGVSSPSLVWIVLSPLVGLITFWLYILVVSVFRGDEQSGLPFCSRHRNYWLWRAWFIVVGFLALVILMGVGMALTPRPVPGKQPNPHWIFGVAGCWMFLFLPAFLVMHLSSMRPTGTKRDSIVLSGASYDFAEALEGEE